MQKDLTEVKIFQKVLGGGGYFLKHPVHLLPIVQFGYDLNAVLEILALYKL